MGIFVNAVLLVLVYILLCACRSAAHVDSESLGPSEMNVAEMGLAFLLIDLVFWKQANHQELSAQKD